MSHRAVNYIHGMEQCSHYLLSHSHLCRVSSASSRHFYFSSFSFRRFFWAASQKTNEQFFLYSPFKHRTWLEKMSRIFVTWNVETKKKSFFDVFFSHVRDEEKSLFRPNRNHSKLSRISTSFELNFRNKTLSNALRGRKRAKKFSLWSFFCLPRSNFRVCVHRILSSTLIARVFVLFKRRKSYWRWRKALASKLHQHTRRPISENLLAKAQKLITDNVKTIVRASLSLALTLSKVLGTNMGMCNW